MLSALWRWLLRRRRRPPAVLLAGLDGAGKTSLLSSLLHSSSSSSSSSSSASVAPASLPSVAPTFGFSCEKVKVGKQRVIVYDVGGAARVREAWQTYYAEVFGVVFVVDASDPARFAEAADALRAALADPRIASKPLLLLANKQDVLGAVSAEEVASQLGLAGVSINTRVVPCVALISGQADAKRKGSDSEVGALSAGVRWLVERVDEEYTELAARVRRDTAAQRAEEERRKLERKARVDAMRAEERLQEQALLSIRPNAVAPEPSVINGAPTPVHKPTKHAVTIAFAETASHTTTHVEQHPPTRHETHNRHQQLRDHASGVRGQ